MGALCGCSDGDPLGFWPSTISNVSDAAPVSDVHLNSSQRCSSIESILLRTEKESPFSRIKLKQIYTTLIEESNDDHLSTPQLRKIFRKLGIRRHCLEDPDLPSFKFLLALRQGQFYKVSKITLSVLLQSKSGCTDKCDILLGLFDNGTSGSLDENALKTMLNCLFEISVDAMPLLAVGETTEGKLPTGEIIKLQRSLNSRKRQYIDETVKDLLRTGVAVTHDDWRRMISVGELDYLLEASQLRRTVLAACFDDESEEV